MGGTSEGPRCGKRGPWRENNDPNTSGLLLNLLPLPQHTRLWPSGGWRREPEDPRRRYSFTRYAEHGCHVPLTDTFMSEALGLTGAEILAFGASL